uniref:Tripartite motif containing 35-12 n=1 Tax=Sphaeramia orbicularis TaxID=375764 RepID=A0A672YJP8_9TELE
MAEKKIELFESFLSCHVCSETFRDPVSLSCNHSFCSNCLKEFWEKTKNKNCPICKRKSSKDDPNMNFSLKELADLFAGRLNVGSSETKKGEKKVEVVCSKHQEEPKLFSEFNKLHQFLKEEEESRLAALREEEEQKRRSVIREMKRIEEQMSSVSDSICAVEEELQKASAPFLISCKDTQSRARAQCSVSEPQLISGALIHVDKHLGNLSFRVWDKMRDKVHFSPVILDPNTAGGWLHLSDDLTSVRRGDTYQHPPDNPERNTEYASVHGSEGFNSGKHSWDVEVGDHPEWILGLVKESADRKGETAVSPEYGFWCLWYVSGKYSNGAGQTLTVQTSPQRIRVELDYDRGEVSFYNAEDKTHIYTHTDTFTEKLYPYFNVRKAGDAETTDIRICQSKISVTYDMTSY